MSIDLPSILISKLINGGDDAHELLNELHKRPAELGHLTGWLGRISQKSHALGLPEELTILISEEAVRASGFEYDTGELPRFVMERYQIIRKGRKP